MKRILSLIIIFVLLASIAGCGKGSENQSQTPSGTPTEQPVTVTTAPTEAPVAPTEAPAEPTSTPAPVPTALPENAGDFASLSSAFCWNDSAELFSITLSIYPVDDTTSVLQFDYYDAGEDIEIPVQKYYAFTCKLVNKATYVDEEEGLTVFVDNNGDATVSSDNDAYKDITGGYYNAGGAASPDTVAILEYLRNIPEAEIGDFCETCANDEIEESIASAWFHEINLFRDGEIISTFLATDDMTGFCKFDGDACNLIFGNLDSTLEQINYYDLEAVEDDFGEDIGNDVADVSEGDAGDNYEEGFVETESFERLIVFPYIYGGTELAVGETSFVDLFTPYQIPYTIEFVSADESIVSTDDGIFTAAAEGETIIQVMLDYSGSRKEYTIPVIVYESENGEDFGSDECADPGFTSWADSVSMRATMSMTEEDGNYSADIYWADSVDTVHHWSLIGTADTSDEAKINLYGSYIIETYDSEGSCTETIVSDEVATSMNFEDTGCLRWNYSFDGKEFECLFEQMTNE